MEYYFWNPVSVIRNAFPVEHFGLYNHLS